RRKLQHRLYLRGELVGQQQCPATAERPARFLARQLQFPPSRIERIEEIARLSAAVFALQRAVGQQRQRLAAGRKQDVPAAVRGARGGRLEQQRIARRRQALQRQQVAGRVEVAGDEH